MVHILKETFLILLLMSSHLSEPDLITLPEAVHLRSQPDLAELSYFQENRVVRARLNFQDTFAPPGLKIKSSPLNLLKRISRK